MAFVIADRVRETTTTTGTGTITLGGAVTNFETFTANLSNSDTTYYAIVDNTNGAFEVGLGTFTASGTTLARSVLASSNSNNLVDFGAGTKDVFITIPASKMVVEDGSNNVAIGGTVTATAFSGSGASLTGVDVVNDTSPQLGGNLDLNGNDIVTTSNADLELAPNGTGHVTVKGNDNQGAIQFNCENNSHGQIVKAAPHSESASNTLTLPSTGGDARLVSTASTATLTNKTLTTPVIEEIDSTGSITLDAATDIILDAGGADVTLKDDGTTFGSLTNSSGELVIKSGSTPTTAVTFSGANATFSGNLTVNGTTTTVDTTNTTIKDSLLELNSGATSNSNDCGIVIERGSTGDNAIIMWDESSDTFVVGTTTATGASTGNLTVTDGALQAGSLDISGDVDVDGTLEADAMTLNGTTITTTATLSTGISNGNVLVANANIVDNDFLRVDGTSIEGRSASELATDIGAATTDDIIALSIALG
tara:strand:+ start:10461 stop:11900 length:1440 start_codon:yes stop_codon:yes gene_type:complete